MKCRKLRLHRHLSMDTRWPLRIYAWRKILLCLNMYWESFIIYGNGKIWRDFLKTYAKESGQKQCLSHLDLNLSNSFAIQRRQRISLKFWIIIFTRFLAFTKKMPNLLNTSWMRYLCLISLTLYSFVLRITRFYLIIFQIWREQWIRFNKIWYWVNKNFTKTYSN